MRLYCILILFTSQALAGAPERCIVTALYQEARGASAEELVMVGNTIVNEHKRSGKTICEVARKGYQHRAPPDHVASLYRHVAKGVVSGAIADLTQGATHFNEGRKPAWKGRVKRQTKHFVFYRVEK